MNRQNVIDNGWDEYIKGDIYQLWSHPDIPQDTKSLLITRTWNKHTGDIVVFVSYSGAERDILYKRILPYLDNSIRTFTDTALLYRHMSRLGVAWATMYINQKGK